MSDMAAACDAAVAPSHTCNACAGQIQGDRFRCLVCPNFDLCSACAERQDLCAGAHSPTSHPLAKVSASGVATHSWRDESTGAQSARATLNLLDALILHGFDQEALGRHAELHPINAGAVHRFLHSVAHGGFLCAPVAPLLHERQQEGGGEQEVDRRPGREAGATDSSSRAPHRPTDGLAADGGDQVEPSSEFRALQEVKFAALPFENPKPRGKNVLALFSMRACALGLAAAEELAFGVDTGISLGLHSGDSGAGGSRKSSASRELALSDVQPFHVLASLLVVLPTSTVAGKRATRAIIRAVSRTSAAASPRLISFLRATAELKTFSARKRRILSALVACDRSAEGVPHTVSATKLADARAAALHSAMEEATDVFTVAEAVQRLLCRERLFGAGGASKRKPRPQKARRGRCRRRRQRGRRRRRGRSGRGRRRSAGQRREQEAQAMATFSSAVSDLMQSAAASVANASALDAEAAERSLQDRIANEMKSVHRATAALSAGKRKDAISSMRARLFTVTQREQLRIEARRQQLLRSGETPGTGAGAVAATCQLCFSQSRNVGASMLQCSHCAARVHEVCARGAGLVSSAAASPTWTCDGCATALRGEDPAEAGCALCSRGVGVLTRVEDAKADSTWWIHPICATAAVCSPLSTWAPYFYGASSCCVRTTCVQQALDALHDMERPWVPQKCNLCAYTSGVVLTCGANPLATRQHPGHTCQWSAHASCAADAGVLFVLPSVDQAEQAALQPRCFLHRPRSNATVQTPSYNAAESATPGPEAGEEEVGDGLLPARDTAAASVLRLVMPAPTAEAADGASAATDMGPPPPVPPNPVPADSRRKVKEEEEEAGAETGTRGEDQAHSDRSGLVGPRPVPVPASAPSPSPRKAVGAAGGKKAFKPPPAATAELRAEASDLGSTKPDLADLPPDLAPRHSRTPRRATLGKPARYLQQESPKPSRPAASRVRASRKARPRKRAMGSEGRMKKAASPTSDAAEPEATASPPRRRRRGNGEPLLMLW